MISHEVTITRNGVTETFCRRCHYFDVLLTDKRITLGPVQTDHSMGILWVRYITFTVGRQDLTYVVSEGIPMSWQTFEVTSRQRLLAILWPIHKAIYRHYRRQRRLPLSTTVH